MLERLADIDWDNRGHAYGSAADVPDLLRALASLDPARRSQAMHALYGNIWHQGTVYEATSFAAPFLVELLEEPSVQGKEEILGLLQAISHGTSYLDVHQVMEGFRHERKTAEFQERRRTEMMWVEKAREAVSAGASVYLRLLTGPSVKVRLASAYVLGNCTDRARQVAAALRIRLRRERLPLVRASLLWAWLSLRGDDQEQRRLDHSSPRRVKKRLRQFVRSRKEPPIVRLIAGLGLMRFLPEREHRGFASFFAAALARCPRGLSQFPWAEGDPMQFIYRVLARQRALVLSLFSIIARAPEHPHREDTVHYLEEITLAQPRARPAVALLLGELLDSANGKVRRTAARLLGQIGSSGRLAAEPLLKALADSDLDVSRRAALALAKLGDVRAVPFLKERLERGDSHLLVLNAVKHLGGAASETIPPLRGLLARGKGNVRVLAAHALGLIGEESVEAVADVADALRDPAAGGGAGWALMQWGPLARQAAPSIVEFLEDGAGESLARINAIKALGAMGLHARPALGVLEQLLADPTPGVRIAAAAALWQVAPRATHGITVIAEVLQNAEGKPGRSHFRAGALEALETIGPAGRSCAPLVKELLDSTDQWVRVRAARALWKMGEPVELFLPLLIEELRCRPIGLLAAECLAEIGPTASLAVPRLQEILNSEWSVSAGGGVDEIIDREEEFLQAVSRALRSVQGTE